MLVDSGQEEMVAQALHDGNKTAFSSPVGSFSFSSIRVYLAMLEFRPPHRPLSEVTAMVAVLGAVTAAIGEQSTKQWNNLGVGVQAQCHLCCCSCCSWCLPATHLGDPQTA